MDLYTVGASIEFQGSALLAAAVTAVIPRYIDAVEPLMVVACGGMHVRDGGGRAPVPRGAQRTGGAVGEDVGDDDGADGGAELGGGFVLHRSMASATSRASTFCGCGPPSFPPAPDPSAMRCPVRSPES